MNLIKIQEYLKYSIKSLFQPKFLYKSHLRKYQLEKINDIYRYARKNSPFYNSFYKNAPHTIKSFEDLKKIPILRKSIMKKAIHEGSIICKDFRKKSLYCGHTTGSTGTPLKVCFDKECIKARALVQFRLWKNIGALPYKKFAKIWRQKELTEYEKKLEKAGLFLYIPVGNINEPIKTALTNKKIRELINKLIEFNPQIIRGYVSALHNIALFLKKTNLRFKNLEAVITSAEYLPPHLWDLFEEVFGCPVYNLYGGTEAPAIAINNKYSRNLTISEDLYFVEVLDENGNDVKPGQPGYITITDLHCKAMPLIRYQIGDLAIIDKQFYNFGDKFRYFTSVIGRSDDIIELDDGFIIYPHLWYVYFREYNWVNKFRIIQLTKSHIHIQLEIIDAKYTENVEYIIQRIKSLYPNVTFSWEIVDKFDLNKGEKFRNIISLVFNKNTKEV